MALTALDVVDQFGTQFRYDGRVLETRMPGVLMTLLLDHNATAYRQF